MIQDHEADSTPDNLNGNGYFETDPAGIIASVCTTVKYHSTDGTYLRLEFSSDPSHGPYWLNQLLAIQLAAASFAPQSFWPATLAAAVAILWQCSPLKQRCLNRGHLHPEIRAFGSAADLDTVRFGVTHGFWCVASCWAMMLAPMLLPRWHVLAMAMVSVLMLGEWLEHPAPPSWRRRGISRLKRMAEAQTRFEGYRHPIRRVQALGGVWIWQRFGR